MPGASGMIAACMSSIPQYRRVCGHRAIVAALRAAVRDARPDVVHLFKPKGYAGLVMPLLRGIPVVLDTDDWEGAGGWNERGLYSPMQRRLFAWQERSLPRRAAHVTVASRTLEAQQWGLGIPPGRVTYLPNALDARALCRVAR